MSQPDDLESVGGPQPLTAPHRTFVDLSPLKASPAFARLWIGTSISGVGAWLTMTAVGLLIFDITGSTFLVALVGPISLIPVIAAGLWGGMLADAFDRRAVAIITAIISWCSTLALLGFSIWDATISHDGRPHRHLAALRDHDAERRRDDDQRGDAQRRDPPHPPARHGLARRGAQRPHLRLQMAIGPALAGFLIAFAGFPITFAIDAVLFTAGFIGIVGLPKLPPLSDVARPGWQSLKDGMAFLRRSPNIRMSFIVDIIAMGLGRPIVLFPAIGTIAIGGGAVTVGVLTAAMAIGTFFTGLFSGPVASVHRHGIAISRAIMGYAGFTILFGLVVGAAMLGWFGPVGPSFHQVSWPALILAFLAMAGTGATDEVSAIFRSTMLLTAAPDDMRGRLQGIFTVVVTGGPRIGDLVAGGIATAVALVVPPLTGPDALWAPGVFGGAAILILIWSLLRASASWRAYDARNPTP